MNAGAYLNKSILRLDAVKLEFTIDNGNRGALYPVRARLCDGGLDLIIQFVRLQETDGLMPSGRGKMLSEIAGMSVLSTHLILCHELCVLR